VFSVYNFLEKFAHTCGNIYVIYKRNKYACKKNNRCKKKLMASSATTIAVGAAAAAAIVHTNRKVMDLKEEIAKMSQTITDISHTAAEALCHSKRVQTTCDSLSYTVSTISHQPSPSFLCSSASTAAATPFSEADQQRLDSFELRLRKIEDMFLEKMSNDEKNVKESETTEMPIIMIDDSADTNITLAQNSEC
jgi:hypothetical protein